MECRRSRNASCQPGSIAPYPPTTQPRAAVHQGFSYGRLSELKRHRYEPFDPTIPEHHGSVVELRGDRPQVKFAGIVDGVTCAAAIQSSIANRSEAVLRISGSLSPWDYPDHSHSGLPLAEQSDNPIACSRPWGLAMHMDQVSTFLEVAETRNFNRAADRLNVTQSTVSARIRALEDRLGRRLFVRDHSGARLTPAGERLRRYALNLQRLWRRAEQDIALPKAFRASIGLGSQVSLWEQLILRWIPWMRRAAPDVAVHVEADYSPSLMRQVADGVLDIGVMYTPTQRPGLIVEELLVEQLILVSTQPPKSERSWKDNYVLVDWGLAFRQAHDETFADVAPAVSVGLGPLGLRYVLENGGSGYFPLRLIQPLMAEGCLYRVPETPVMRRPAYAVYAASPADEELLQLGLHGLREIVQGRREGGGQAIEISD